YGTNTLGCTSSAQIPVVVLINPTVTIATSNTLVCSGETVTLNALGAGTYTWSTAANGSSVAVIPTGNITVYSVTGTAASNTCTASETIAIAAITPSVSFTSSLAICSGANATLNASGAATYTWNNVPLGASGQIVYTPATTSTYTLVANTTSLNTNCLSTHLATVFVNPNPTVSIVAAITASICKGETNTLTVSGASSYTWLTIGSNSTQISVTPSATTIYTVVGVTASGCVGNAQLQVKVNTCTGLSETIKAVEFVVFPNPATNAFYISSDTEMVLELYNYNGQLMRVMRIEKGNTLVDVKNVNPGLYFIKEQNSGSMAGRKIIIN
ncbi:MAG: T9SS type A sorting domain-containing protein, partial [Bacteroidia bacterium]|nr:T9SS type A sorting domain-containing protein [Bacteroidia bacterium]